MTAQGWGLVMLVVAAVGLAVLLSATLERLRGWARLRWYGRRRTWR